MLCRIEMRTRDRIYSQTIRTVRDISRDDRARIATCSLRTLTDRLKNYSIDIYFKILYYIIKYWQVYSFRCRFELLNDDEVVFKMLQSNSSRIVGQLDDIRKHPK